MLVPEINLQMRNREYKDGEADPTVSDSMLILRQGEIISGMFDKSIMGTSSGGLLHCIWLEYGPEVAKNFLTQS